MRSGISDRFHLVNFETAGGVFGMIALVSQFFQNCDRTIQRRAELLDKKSHPGFVKLMGVISGTGSGKDFQMREMLATRFDDSHGLIFVLDRDDEDFGFLRAGGFEQRGAGRIPVVTFQSDLPQEVDVIAVPFQYRRHATRAAEESAHGVTKPTESGEEDFGLVILHVMRTLVLVGLGSSKSGKDDLLNEDQERWCDGHGKRDGRDHLPSEFGTDDALADRKTSQHKSEFSALSQCRRKEESLVKGQAKPLGEPIEHRALEADQTQHHHPYHERLGRDQGKIDACSHGDEKHRQQERAL